MFDIISGWLVDNGYTIDGRVVHNVNDGLSDRWLFIKQRLQVQVSVLNGSVTVYRGF